MNNGKRSIKPTPRMLAITQFFYDLPHYFVGGAVRDILMGETPKDYDLTTPAHPDAIEAYIKGKGKRVWKIGQKFGTLGVKLDGELVEITTFRTEKYDGQGRKPEVKWGQTIAEDLQRRDFTINAIAAWPSGLLIDPFDGARDIEEKTLRAVQNAKIRFKEDPLRILRGVRMAARFDLLPEERTMDRMETMRWELLRLSKERIVDEIGKMMMLPPPQARDALEAMFLLKHWQVIFPELHLQHGFDQQNPHHPHKLHNHSLNVFHSALFESITLGDQPETRKAKGWAALLHDVAKPFTKSLHKSGTRYNYIDHHTLGADIARRWTTDYRFSNADVKFINETILHHLEDDNWLRPHDKAGKTVDPSYYLEGGGPHPNLIDGAYVHED